MNRRFSEKNKTPGSVDIMQVGARRTTLLVVRHGETIWNKEEKFQGHGDSPLTDTGIRQAVALGHRLSGMSFDLLISSDLGRTRQTAALICEETGHLPVFDSRLRERNYGVLEGLGLDEIRQRHPAAFARLASDDPDYVIPLGESHRQHHARVVDFVEDFLAEHENRTAVVVAHGGVLDCLFRFVACLPLHQPRCYTSANAGLNIIANGVFYGTRRWVIESWNDTTHLGELTSRHAF